MGTLTRLTLGVDSGAASGWGLARRDRIVDCGVAVLDDVRAIRIPAIYGGLVVVEIPDRVDTDKGVQIRDIVRLAVRAGRVVERYLDRGNHVRTVAPVQWKGSVPKPIHNARIMSALDPAELAMVADRQRAIPEKLRHNLIDALGITLWAIGRDVNRGKGS